MNEDEFPINEDDWTRAAVEQLAAILVPLFRACQDRGLSGPEAAALAAAYCQQVIPQQMQGPQEGS